MSTATEYWVTTSKNPFDPFEDFENWYHYDEFEKRYCTTGLMARFATAEDDDPESWKRESDRRAAMIIVNEIPLISEDEVYELVTREITIDDDE